MTDSTEENKMADEKNEDTGENPASEDAAGEQNNGVVADAMNSALNSEDQEDIPWSIPTHLDYSNRKVLLHNVTKFYDTKSMTRTINQWVSTHTDKVEFEIEKVKKPPRENWAIITLKEENMVDPFIVWINGDKSICNKKGEKVTARRATEGDDAGSKRKRGEDESAPTSTKRQRLQEATKDARRPLTDDEIREKITPYWRMTSDEQLDKKMKEMIRKCGMKLIKDLKDRFRALQKDKSRKEKGKQSAIYKWIEGKRPIFIKPIVSAPSPLRNKCEFTFGYRYLFDANSKLDEDASAECQRVPAVGFMTTGWAGGVSRPHCCANIPTEACQLVDIVEHFLSTSPLPPYDNKLHSGVWRTMTVRSSRRTSQCMVIIVHSPITGGQGESDDGHQYCEHFEGEKERLISAFTSSILEVPGLEPLKVTSIFFQEFDGLSAPPPEHPVQHVFGNTELHERLGKCTFQISPGAFFQVNTEGAEILYEKAVEKIREVSVDPQNTLLFDVCCGTGTIGLTCMKEGAVGKVVGVDISEPAIEDAKKNAELNGFSGEDKARFVAARAEKVLSKEIGKAKQLELNFVAVVDPAREGLHPEVVATLRSNERIHRIVYVSCNPTKTLVRDAVLLCAPPTKKYFGRPFKVVEASPVDMFPLTEHCEMVMTFDRMSEEEMAN